jgi:hypothetical protein
MACIDEWLAASTAGQSATKPFKAIGFFESNIASEISLGLNPVIVLIP